ncbi:MAG: hypothetical protein KC414_15215, partial [Romboutsia sp.]|nr:hypothetical protein [Romboutsia sp.]
MALEQIAYTCPRCGSKGIKKENKKRKIFRRSWKPCSFEVSIWIGTIFYESKFKPEVILAISTLWLEGISNKLIISLLNIS